MFLKETQKDYKSVKSAGFSLALCLMLLAFSLNSFALNQDSQKSLEQMSNYTQDLENLHELLIAQFGPDRAEAQMALLNIQAQIERVSYKTTMRLCEGYRRLSGMGPIPGLQRYLNKVHSSDFKAKSVLGRAEVQALDGQSKPEKSFYYMVSWKDRRGEVLSQQQSLKEFVGSGGYYFSESESVGSYLRIAGEGFSTVFEDLLGGAKYDHNLAEDRGTFDASSWFGSVYMYYLFRSPGSLKAMVHCMGYDERGDFRADRLNNFMNFVGYIDGAGSLVAHGVTGGAIGKALTPVFKWISKARAFGWLVKSAKATWKSPKGKMMIIGGMIIGGESLRASLQKHMSELESFEKSRDSIQSREYNIRSLDAHGFESLVRDLLTVSKTYDKAIAIKIEADKASGFYSMDDYELKMDDLGFMIETYIHPNEAQYVDICKEVVQLNSLASKEEKAVLELIKIVFPLAKLDINQCYQP